MTELYLRHARNIRDTSNYKIGELRKDLKALAEKAVPDSVQLRRQSLRLLGLYARREGQVDAQGGAIFSARR